MRKIPLFLGVLVAFGAVGTVVTLKYLHLRRWKVLISETIGTHSVYIEAQRGEEIPTPGYCMVRASVSGDSSTPPFEEVFSGGWRLVVVSGRPSEKKEAGPGLIELGAERRINGAGIAKQYYRIINGELVLVRLEAEDGKLFPNRYDAPNQTIGPKIPTRTAAEWENALRSSEDAEILAALTWLGGVHAEPSSKPVEKLLHEDLALARLVEEVYRRPGVVQRIGELVKSSNTWIREAAEWAKEPHYEMLRDPGGPPMVPSWK